MTEKSDHPPRPRFTVRVGITGHRPNKFFGPVVKTIEEQLAWVFKGVEEAATDIWKANAAFYAAEIPQFRLISNFAEGADQLAVLAYPDGWLIEAILPFPKDEYVKDFSESATDDTLDAQKDFLTLLQKASSVTQLPSRSLGSRNRGYLDAGSYLLRQVDVLVAVWDGMPPQPGGTGALVREAHQGGIPVIWLSTLNKQVPRLITGFDETGAPSASDADCTDGPLKSALEPIFDGPNPAVSQSRRSAKDALMAFYGEVWRPYCYFPAYDALARVAILQRPRLVIRARPFIDQCANWDSFFLAAPRIGRFRMGRCVSRAVFTSLSKCVCFFLYSLCRGGVHCPRWCLCRSYRAKSSRGCRRDVSNWDHYRAYIFWPTSFLARTVARLQSTRRIASSWTISGFPERVRSNAR
jgi:hypothetical protein